MANDQKRRWKPRVRGNVLLDAIPERERAAVSSCLEPVGLSLREVLQEPGQPLQHVWFVHSGVCSMISQMQNGAAVELATIGNEGMVGISVLLDARRVAHKTLVQIAGTADRMAVGAFLDLLPSLPVLHRLLLRYALAVMTQIAQGSACNRVHPIESRCARWLLQTHDRVEGDSFPLTHEFLAQMLGVTRPSVSIAAGILQKAGMIDYSRGVIRILDRPGLEQAACECYAVITSEFERLVRDRDD